MLIKHGKEGASTDTLRGHLHLPWTAQGFLHGGLHYVERGVAKGRMLSSLVVVKPLALTFAL